MDEQRRRIRVLICDDDRTVRALLTAKVFKFDHELVGEAANGIQAMNLFVEKRPDVVFLDIRMPMGDGLTVLRFIRDIDKDVRVVMLTEDDTPHAVKTALSLGANEYVIKSSLDSPRFEQAMSFKIKPNPAGF